ncbi:ATP-binding cassette domain-containing protein [Sphingobium sp.]|uniref:ATP-binding cassette domain-containing protein n=1 Tax=Sphingobium sp. TaxID=1912891 RepID=UPI003B3A2D79
MSFDIDLTCKLGTRIIRTQFQSNHGIVSLLGPSGSGKSSILNMIAGLLRPEHGHVRIADKTLFDKQAGTNISIAARRSGYIFQDARLFPHMTVRQNLTYGARRSRNAMGLGQATALLGIEALMDRKPATLSGGEAQRVAIGRALLSGPDFFLMDEPCSSLDHDRRSGILDQIRRLHAQTAIPILYVSHDPWEMEQLNADVIALA